MATSHLLGFPRIGIHREMKWAVEAYWNGTSDAQTLLHKGQEIRRANWTLQSKAGIDFLPVGDFSWYDHVLDLSTILGVIPERFRTENDPLGLEAYFCMARGRGSLGQEMQPCEMTKWFDTNYHYTVPEFHSKQRFDVNMDQFSKEIIEAQSISRNIKPVLIGPLTYLWLGKTKDKDFDRLELIEDLVKAYQEILVHLESLGVSWLQLDEPILSLDLPLQWQQSFEPVYRILSKQNPQIMVANYFGGLGNNIDIACRLPVAALHIDAIRAPDELNDVATRIDNDKILSAGIVDGRNIWRCDLDDAFELLEPIQDLLGDRLWLSSSCSLLHCPVDLQEEKRLDEEIKSWLAFSVQKISEIKLLTEALNSGEEAVGDEFEANRQIIQNRTQSEKVNIPAVIERMSSINESMMTRKSIYKDRKPKQRDHLHLPLLPTTTIGSFPQTKELRTLHSDFKAGRINEKDYHNQLRNRISEVIRFQEKLGIDVLVHGEVERTDMVEYFASLLDGFAITDNGWVQSYGSRCVKPPLIYGDVQRRAPMTIAWISYAQSLTQKPVKGMLTGPMTMIRWSFVRDDLTQFETAMQVAMALRDEVQDLEKAGISVIQIDEPAFREGLPLRKRHWQEYLIQSIACFRLASTVVEDRTQIHTHMCYSEFNDIISAIAELDADVISIEASRSDMELLRAFENFQYPNEIGPGVYDIHSPRIPSVSEINERILETASVIPIEKLWVNPDCGLKTRTWKEVEAALGNMVAAVKLARTRYEG
jgi:5-methyltetrahydropteroyltriglutamate--homocysteine methyltransferase